MPRQSPGHRRRSPPAAPSLGAQARQRLKRLHGVRVHYVLLDILNSLLRPMTVRFETLTKFDSGNGLLAVRIHNVGFPPGAPHREFAPLLTDQVRFVKHSWTGPLLFGSCQEDGFVAVAGGDKPTLAREMHGLVMHQAFDLHVLQDSAAILQRHVHAEAAMGGGIASITYQAPAMGIVQVPSKTRCVSPLTPEFVSHTRPSVYG